MKIAQGAGAIAIAILLQVASAEDTSPCIQGGYSIEFDGECSYDNANLISELETIFNTTNCLHTFAEEIRLQLKLGVTATDKDVHEQVKAICITAWENAAKIPFDYTHMKGDQFEQIYYNGGTSWNEEVETNLETGSPTNVLRNDASRVRTFYDSLAKTDHVEWPNYMPNFDTEQCEINTAMCCWPQDRQADDNNGNCAKPYDTNCYDKDPADNTDLCFVDLSRSPSANMLDGTGHIDFPLDNGDGEGAIHCHGFAWANDDYDKTSRFKANNLFYVSMYDHMHQRGYVRNIPGAPMCACVEQMPTVSRSDCTQIDVDESYKFVHNPTTDEFTAELLKTRIQFNACQGRYNRNNNLHAYVARLVQEGKLNNDQRSALDKYIVGDNNCRDLSEHEMIQKGYGYGFNVDEKTWLKVAGSGNLFGSGEIGREGFRVAINENNIQIVWRVCIFCVASHQNIYYRRFTSIPDDMDLLGMLKNTWTETNNKRETDFKLYSTLEDAVDDKNAWTHYSFRDGRGFPYESGPNGRVRNQYRTFSRGEGQFSVAFYVMKGEGGISPYKTGSVTGTDIGNFNLPGSVLKKDDIYYITGAGQDIWSDNDNFYFLHEPISSDVTIKAHVSKLHHVSDWTKAGLMIREDLSPNSAHFFCFLSGRQGVIAQWRHGNWLMTRSSTHGSRTGPTPTWLMIKKTGDTYTCSKSSDGIDWLLVHEDTVTMGNGIINAGMALSSNNAHATAEVVFEQYENESHFYPSSTPTLSRSPNYFTSTIQSIEKSELEGYISGLVNVAKGKQAKQSSTEHSGVANRAVDGNTNGDYDTGSVTHTRRDDEAFWEVDLGEYHLVEYVAIYNRLDYESRRLKNFVVELRGDTDSVIDSVEYDRVAGSVTLVHFGSPQEASKVRIRLKRADHLTLAEVEVYAEYNFPSTSPSVS